jgi:hypothetical protein
VTQAWVTGYVALAGFGGKMPKLDDLLSTKQAVVKQTAGQMGAFLSAIGLPQRKGM